MGVRRQSLVASGASAGPSCHGASDLSWHAVGGPSTPRRMRHPHLPARLLPACLPVCPRPAHACTAPACPTPAATAADVLTAGAEKQGWQPADSLLRLEGEWAAAGAGWLASRQPQCRGWLLRGTGPPPCLLLESDSRKGPPSPPAVLQALTSPGSACCTWAGSCRRAPPWRSRRAALRVGAAMPPSSWLRSVIRSQPRLRALLFSPHLCCSPPARRACPAGRCSPPCAACWWQTAGRWGGPAHALAILRAWADAASACRSKRRMLPLHCMLPLHRMLPLPGPCRTADPAL